jgi:hypothetical protein
MSHCTPCRGFNAGLRMNKAHVTHPELKATFCLDVLGVKKNPNGAMHHCTPMLMHVLLLLLLLLLLLCFPPQVCA